MALGAASLVPWACWATAPASKYKLGYQLYSVRDQMSKDPIATLKALKAMGYQDFETYGFDAASNTIYGLKPLQFKSILTDLNLSVSSGHYNFSALMDKPDDQLSHYVDSCIEAALIMENAYITWPFLDEAYRNAEGYVKLGKKLSFIGRQISHAGLGFAYHNHGYEFADLGGRTGFDIIVDQTPPEDVKFQMDMYWVMHQGKTTPKKLVEQHPGRFVMWHIKDMDKVSRDYTELGNGAIDYHHVLPDPKTSGLHYFYLEQGGNYAQNSMQSAATSAAYFKRELRQYLQ